MFEVFIHKYSLLAVCLSKRKEVSAYFDTRFIKILDNDYWTKLSYKCDHGYSVNGLI